MAKPRMFSSRRAFLLGFRDTLAFQGGVIPFGLLFATIASAAGFPWWLTLFCSIIVFAGSSQLVFIDLLQTLASPFQAVLGSNVVNARHMIYSAAVSKNFADFPLRWKLLLAYLLTDQLYAISISDKKVVDEMTADVKPWFYFGSGICTWIFWVASTSLGIAFGHFIPASWNLGFSIPLMFMPLVFSVSKDRFAALTCAFAVLFVFLFRDLPYGFGIFLAILSASLVGYAAQAFLELRR